MRFFEGFVVAMPLHVVKRPIGVQDSSEVLRCIVGSHFQNSGLLDNVWFLSTFHNK